MNREFHVIYRQPAGAAQTVNVISESDLEVKSMFEREGFHIMGITQIRAVVDWEKPVWDLDEFAAAMSIKGGTLSGKKGNGKIPWSSEVGGVPRRVALKWIEGTLNPAGKKVLEDIES